MKETSVNQEDGQTKEGPDYFSYYTGQVKDLISQEIDFPPSTGQAQDRDKVEQSGGFGVSRPLFSNSVGAGLSVYKKERLDALLPQAARALKPEVDEMLGPVISMRELQEKVRNRDSASGKKGTKSDADGEQISDNAPQEDDDLEFLLGSDKTLVEESIKKYAGELLSTLDHMESKLQELLDYVASTCRPMTSTEKLVLQGMVRNLPPANFDRVADIVQRQKPVEAQQSEEIVVNTEQEDNITVWRLYSYVQAVERAKKLVP